MGNGSRWLAQIIGVSGTPRGDAGLAVIVAAFAGVLWWESLKVPPPFFDPLGSAAVPKALALVLAALAAVILARAMLALPWKAPGQEEGYRPRPDIAVGIVVLAVAYIGAMQLKVLGFQAATLVFLIAAAALLGRLDRATLMIGAASALVIGIGGTLLFTRFFYIDLPR